MLQNEIKPWLGQKVNVFYGSYWPGPHRQTGYFLEVSDGCAVISETPHPEEKDRSACWFINIARIIKIENVD